MKQSMEQSMKQSKKQSMEWIELKERYVPYYPHQGEGGCKVHGRVACKKRIEERKDSQPWKQCPRNQRVRSSSKPCRSQRRSEGRRKLEKICMRLVEMCVIRFQKHNLLAMISCWSKMPWDSWKDWNEDDVSLLCLNRIVMSLVAYAMEAKSERYFRASGGFLKGLIWRWWTFHFLYIEASLLRFPAVKSGIFFDIILSLNK